MDHELRVIGGGWAGSTIGWNSETGKPILVMREDRETTHEERYHVQMMGLATGEIFGFAIPEEWSFEQAVEALWSGYRLCVMETHTDDGGG